MTASIYTVGNMAPVPDEITVEDLDVAGAIPEELEGRWLRNGPNPIGEIDLDNFHWFTGHAMVHGVRLRGGRAEWYRNRWVRGDNESELLGREPVERTGSGRFSSGPNTSVGGFGGHTWAMVEAGGAPMQLSYGLESVAFDGFGGTLTNGFTAHPKYDSITGELHAICYCWPDLVDHVEYVVIGPDGTVTKTVDVPVPDMPMIHDMSLTGRWAIVYDLPITVSLDLVTRGRTFPFSWNPDHAARVGLLDRDADTADDIIWCDAPQRFVFHPLNAYDTEDGKVVVDLCEHESAFDTDIEGPIGDGAPTLDRWTIDPVRRLVSTQRIDDRGHEMPRHDPRVSGRRHRYGYTMSFTEDPATRSVATFKTDFDTGIVTTHFHGVGRDAAEPVFVPRLDAVDEDDGWVMVAVYDAERDGSDLVILDAQDFAGPEVARIRMPRRIPAGFHGAWVPDTSTAPV